jgi:hypothetical protein
MTAPHFNATLCLVGVGFSKAAEPLKAESEPGAILVTYAAWRRRRSTDATSKRSGQSPGCSISAAATGLTAIRRTPLAQRSSREADTLFLVME